MSTMREQIIETTSALLEAQGYHATGLNQILAESGAPKGSLYYYFPQGKEELTAAAVERSGRLTAERIRSELAKIEDATEAIQSFIQAIAYHVEASGFSAGGPLAIVAMETVNSSERLNTTCREAYGLLQHAFQEKLVRSGQSEARATQLATFVISADACQRLSPTPFYGSQNKPSMSYVSQDIQTSNQPQARRSSGLPA